LTTNLTTSFQQNLGFILSPSSLFPLHRYPRS
jgi:hypothetical protein